MGIDATEAMEAVEGDTSELEQGKGGRDGGRLNFTEDRCLIPTSQWGGGER